MENIFLSLSFLIFISISEIENLFFKIFEIVIYLVRFCLSLKMNRI